MGLEQMLANLIENALKYGAGSEPPDIRISGRSIGDRIEISVADKGRGIDPRDHERVFDLFRRSGQQDRPGEGIGLPTCARWPIGWTARSRSIPRLARAPHSP
jgi:signal transduction histidine kinase